MAHLVKEERKSIAATFNIGVTVAYPDTEKKRLAVILIMGTGKTNRDGNERGFHTDFYKKLSDTFVVFSNLQNRCPMLKSRELLFAAIAKVL